MLPIHELLNANELHMEQLLRARLSELGLAPNVLRILKGQGITTLKELTANTRDELLEKLHVSDPTLRSYREKGLIPEPVTIGGRVLYDKAAILKALEERKIKIRKTYKLNKG